MKRVGIMLALSAMLLTVAWNTNCGGALNPAFVNETVGGVVPVTPGPGAAFVLVRCSNVTGQQVEFIVSVERQLLVTDDNGDPQLDEDGNFVTTPVIQTVSLITQPTGTASELGTLFPCSETPVTKVGLGENLQPTDIAAFVGGQGPTGGAGFGVPATDLNPLVLGTSSDTEGGFFNCGDTISYQAFLSNSEPGGVALQAFLLPGSEQSTQYSGPNTFVNYEQFIQSQLPEDDE